MLTIYSYVTNLFTQTIAHRDHAGLRGGCADFNKSSALSAPLEHHERSPAITLASSGLDATTIDCQTSSFGGS